MWRGPQEYITYEFVLTSPAVSRMPGSSLIVFVMGGRWPYRYCFVGYCFQDLFNIAPIILVLLPSSFFSISLVSVHVVHPYSSIDTTAAWKKLLFLLSVRSDFHMTDSLSIAVYAFATHVVMSVSVDKTLLPRYVNMSSSFKSPPFSVEMSPVWLKRWHGDLHHQLHVPDYLAGIQLGWVYLPESLCHCRSPRP